MDSKLRFSVTFFRKNRRSRAKRSRANNQRNLDEAPTFNSQTGGQVTLQPEAVDPEVSENSSFILQNLKIGSSECLVFFDTGANSHMIDGNIASKEGLQTISIEQTRLRLIAGGQVESEFGKFRFNLGPGDNDKYHEITAVGMNELSTEFHKYGLEEINLEYLKYASDGEKEHILPKTVGGSKVHLLLGIKNTKIQPVLIKVLPSGVGVYLSPFEDVEGSRIIYAGPSKCFTRIDNEQNQESNHAIYTVFGTDIVEELCNTEVYGECRFKPKGKVRISPLTCMVGLKDEIGNLNVIDEPYDCATLDIVRSLIESKDIELELIDFREFSKPEPESMDFSDSEPEFEYVLI